MGRVDVTFFTDTNFMPAAPERKANGVCSHNRLLNAVQVVIDQSADLVKHSLIDHEQKHGKHGVKQCVAASVLKERAALGA